MQLQDKLSQASRPIRKVVSGSGGGIGIATASSTMHHHSANMDIHSSESSSRGVPMPGAASAMHVTAGSDEK